MQLKDGHEGFSRGRVSGWAMVVWLILTALVATPRAGVRKGHGMDCSAFSDALDKTTFEGTNVVGLSALLFDRKRKVYCRLVDLLLHHAPRDQRRVAPGDVAHGRRGGGQIHE